MTTTPPANPLPAAETASRLGHLTDLLTLTSTLLLVAALAVLAVSIALAVKRLAEQSRARRRWQVLAQLGPSFFDQDRLALAAIEASGQFGFGLVTKILHEARRELQGEVGSAIDDALEAVGEHSRLRRLTRSWNRRRRLWAIQILGRCGGQSAAAFLRDLLTHPDPTTRRVVRSALAGLPGAEPRRAAMESFVRDESEPFGWGATFFARVGRSAPDELLSWVRSAQVENRHRKLVLEALTDVEYLEALDLAREYLVSDDPELRASAARALAKSGRAADRSALATALRDRVWFVRSAAAGALARFGHLDEETTDRLILSLGDRNWWVRYNAARALQSSTIGDDEQAQIVERYLAADVQQTGPGYRALQQGAMQEVRAVGEGRWIH